MQIKATNIKYKRNGITTVTGGGGQAITLYPNGEDWVEWTVKLDAGGQDQKIPTPVWSFHIETLNGVQAGKFMEKYKNSKCPWTKSRFEADLRDGSIELVGGIKLPPDLEKHARRKRWDDGWHWQVTSDAGSNPITITYTAPHVGTRLKESRPTIEVLVAQAKVNSKKMKAMLEIELSHHNIDSLPPNINGLKWYKHPDKKYLPYVHKGLKPFLKALGQEVSKLGWEHPVVVTDGAAQYGGLYPPHIGHRQGNHLDFRPITADGRPIQINQDGTLKLKSDQENRKYAYDRGRTFALAKTFKLSGASKIIFADQNLQKLSGEGLTVQIEPSCHHNHLHVEWPLGGSNGVKVNFQPAVYEPLAPKALKEYPLRKV